MHFGFEAGSGGFGSRRHSVGWRCLGQQELTYGDMLTGWLTALACRAKPSRHSLHVRQPRLCSLQLGMAGLHRGPAQVGRRVGCAERAVSGAAAGAAAGRPAQVGCCAVPARGGIVKHRSSVTPPHIGCVDMYA